MKIAIVTGGFAGVWQQKRRWSIEHEIEALELSIANQERNLAARKVGLANLKTTLEGIPNQEIICTPTN